MNAKRFALYGSLVAAMAALAACGGGGGGGGSSTPATPTGTVNVQVTDGPGDEFQHVWVTVTAISFHTDPNAVWSASDATWQTTTLPAPVTLDLTTLNNGALNQLFAGLSLPVGSYRQIRFFFDGADAGLDASALATRDSNGTTLQWNDQVEFLDGRNGWAITEAPLEIAYPKQGIQLNGTFNVTAGSTLDLAVDFDLEHIIVPFNHGGLTDFTMRPTLAYYDMSQVGAISGTVNPAQLCQSAAAQTAASPNCAFNLIVKAELLAADGSRHYVARETAVNPVDGSFTLYPLATKDINGNPISAYDIVIRGREMETMLVTGVPVTAGAHPGGTGAAAPTSLQSTAIVLTPNNAEYTAQLATPLTPLSSGYAIFQQTLPGAGAVPYEVRWRNTDPFTGLFRNPIPLQGASSSLHLAGFNGGNTLPFSAVTPQEGAGAFTVADNEIAYYTLSAGTVMPPLAAGAAQTFAPGVPSLRSGVQSGAVDVNLSFSGISADNQCEFVLARFAAIIDTFDCSSLLSNSTPAVFSLSGVPAGASGAAVPGAYYYAYVRLWNSAAPKLSRKVVPLNGAIDLRATGSATVNGTVIGN